MIICCDAVIWTLYEGALGVTSVMLVEGHAVILEKAGNGSEKSWRGCDNFFSKPQHHHETSFFLGPQSLDIAS